MNEIFIVDDDASVRSALSSVFAAEGFQTTGFPEAEIVSVGGKTAHSAMRSDRCPPARLLRP